MILTNDGDLANRLAHPRYGVEKLYRALVAGLPTPEMLAKLTEGVWLSDGKVRAKRARIVGRQGQATIARAGPGRRQETRDPPDAVQARPQGHVAEPDRRRPDQPQGALRRRMPFARRGTKSSLLRKVASGVSVSLPRFFEGGATPPSRDSHRVTSGRAKPLGIR